MDLNLDELSETKRSSAKPSAAVADATEERDAAEAAPLGGGTNAAIATIGRHALVYGAGIVISKLASFIMLPIYTRHLTPADYGVLELLAMTIEIYGILTGMCVFASVFRFHAAYETIEDRNEVLSTAAIGLSSVAAVGALLGILASPLLGDLVLDGTPGSALFFRLFFLTHLAQSVEAVPLLHLRILNRSGTFVVFNVAKLIAALILNIYLVVGLKLGVLGVLISNLTVTAISAAVLFVQFLRRVPARFSAEKLWSMVRFGYPVALSVMGSFVLVFSDRYFLQHYVGTGAVGIYSLGAKFAFLLSALVFTPFEQVWAAQRFEIANRTDAREVYSKVFLYLNIVLGGAALGVSLFTPDVVTVMADPAFHGAIAIVPLLLASQVIHHWASYTNLGLYLNYKTSQIAWAAGAGLVAVTALNFALIPRFGIHGAAWAKVGGYGLHFVAMYVLSQRQYRIGYGWGRIGLLYAILGAGLLIRGSIGHLALVPSTALNCLIVLAAAAALFATVLSAEERRFIRRSIGRLGLISRGLRMART